MSRQEAELEQITQQNKEQLTVLQAQIQALAAAQERGGGAGVAETNTEVAKPQVFDRILS